MTELQFSRFLQRSLEVIERDLSHGYRQLGQSLGGREVYIAIDGDGVSVVPDRDRILLLQRPVAPVVRAVASRNALARLLQGATSLLEATWNEEVQLFGPLDALAAFDETLELYFRCAVRCPSFPALMRAYLDAPPSPVRLPVVPIGERLL